MGNIRKFVYVKLWIATPTSWQASLGEEFWVKKQWSTTRESGPHFDSSIGERRLQQYLTRFLSRVRFHYVPAIKDRRIFEHLLGEIYKVIASHEAFPESLSDFTTALRERTGDLTAGLLNELGVNSVISPPDDLTDLFRSLDFETSIEQGDSYSLTLQRGDGIQVRHIPAILAFLTDRSPEDYHIWGFEEPENSLELANAIEEARLFCQYGEAANKQIFITSHSPAFFALNDPKVARFFVSRSEQHDGRLASKLQTISSDDENAPGELMGETPHLPVISSYLREAHARIMTLRGVGDELAMRTSIVGFTHKTGHQRRNVGFPLENVRVAPKSGLRHSPRLGISSESYPVNFAAMSRGRKWATGDLGAYNGAAERGICRTGAQVVRITRP